MDLRWDLEEPDEVSEGKMMSETQWAWFETQLAAEPKPEVTIVGSGIQVIEAPHLIAAAGAVRRAGSTRRRRLRELVARSSRAIEIV